MNLRDVGLISLGFVLGVAATAMSMVSAAQDVDELDRTFGAIRRKFSDPKVRGQG